ncbi:MAG: squalene synthase HpnC [Betaproteobacteria bacterium]|nr:squalene synthase HpnC [Betaproteobacteria bacterium]
MSADHYENFPVASWLLPARLREPVRAIYGFARSADDIADEGALTDAERLSGLGRYRAELDALEAGRPTQDPVFQRLRPAIAEHRLPLQLFRDLLDAFGQDVVKKRYADFNELMDYCRRSADPVGRLLLRLYRADSAQHLAWSDAICSSLQLINHWQDVALDWQKGRVYLPQDELARFGIPECQIAEGRWNASWAAMMDFQIDRTRGMMAAGSSLVHDLPGRIGFELRLIVASGFRMLDKLQRVRGDVFRRRPVIGKRDWPGILLHAAFG